jgi:hypothetical protein
MSESLIFLVGFIVELILLYIVSRKTTNELFHFFRRFFDDSVVFVIITIIFLPGTIIHEFAHYFMAIALMLHVREISILPVFEKNYIKLGKVVYEKKDFVRGILVGIAPIFAGLFFFWFLSFLHIFPNENIFLTILFGYLIFISSTTMFSSKQDLVDLIYIVPLFLVAGGILFILNINVMNYIEKAPWLEQLVAFLKQLNFYFIVSFVIHITVIIVLKLIQRLWKPSRY